MGDFDKLVKYAKKRHLPVKFVRSVGAFGIAAYDLDDHEVHLSFELDKKDKQTIHVFAHELGHEADFRDCSKGYFVKNAVAVQIFEQCVAYGMRVPKEVAAVIRESEERAFDNGEKILKKVGIKIKKKNLKKWRDEAMLLYEQAFKGRSWKKYSR